MPLRSYRVNLRAVVARCDLNHRDPPRAIPCRVSSKKTNIVFCSQHLWYPSRSDSLASLYFPPTHLSFCWKTGFIPYAGNGYAFLLPAKYNPTKERPFPNQDA